MPGSNARALEKAKSIPADALILDLEDAVAPEAKETARGQVGAAVKGGGYGQRELVIRINALETAWGQADLAAVLEAAPDAILLPKTSSAGEIAGGHETLTRASAASKTRLWAMIETPLAILNLKEIAATCTQPGARLDCFVLGTQRPRQGDPRRSHRRPPAGPLLAVGGGRGRPRLRAGCARRRLQRC